MTTRDVDALGFDPAPGSPARLERIVYSLNRVGQQLGDAHAKLSKLGKSDGFWEGQAADAFTATVGRLPKYLRSGHDSLLDAAAALDKWKWQLTDFQAQSARYEDEAETARRNLAKARTNPDLKLAGQTFTSDEELRSAEKRLRSAEQRVSDAAESLNAVIRKAEELAEAHTKASHDAAEAIRKAADHAVDKGDILKSLVDGLKTLDKGFKLFVDAFMDWLKDHADTIYKIGDWLGYASAGCDVLAAIFSETLVGAVVFEAIGMSLNMAALEFHAVGWKAGAKNASKADLALDLAGFVPFGDFARLGKVGLGAFKGVKIPMKTLDFGAKAADSWKRAENIIEQVGGTAGARFEEGMKGWSSWNGTKKAEAIYLTADNFKDRLQVSAMRHLADHKLYSLGAKFSDAPLQKLAPALIENTPLRHIPALADSVKPIVDETGGVVGKYIDPRSWTARGYEALTGSVNVAKEAARTVQDDVQYLSEEVEDKTRQVRNETGRIVSKIDLF